MSIHAKIKAYPVDYLNVLHISDFHLHRDQTQQFNQKTIVEGLIRKLEQVNSTNLNVDAIVFSGDLVQAADGGDYNQAKEILLRIADACGKSGDEVIVCPGNHDASRLAIQKHSSIILAARSKNRDINEVNSIFFNKDILSSIDEIFDVYNKGVSGLGPKTLDFTPFHSTRYLESLNIVFLSINTAALTFAGIEGLARDEGNLLFPEIVLADAISKINVQYPGSMIFVVGHHPLPFLHPTSGDALRNSMIGDCGTYLYGHMHKANPENVQNAFGHCSFIQAGALYEGRDRWSGFGIVSKTCESPHVRMSIQKWYSQKRKFDDDLELTEGKYFFMSREAEEYWTGVPQRPNWADMENWRKASLVPLLAEECNQTLTTKSLDSVFVEPEFERDVYVETAQGKELRNKPDILSMSDLQNSNENFIVSAPSESGKTATIRYCARSMAVTHATKLEATPSKNIGKRKSEIIHSLTRSRLIVGIDPETKDAIKPIEKKRD